MTTHATLERPGLAAELRAATSDAHERLDRRITAARPFESRARFAGFVALQYRFFAAIEPLYREPQVLARLGDIAGLSRLGAAAADLADLGAPVPANAGAAAVVFPEAIGWLYVAEATSGRRSSTGRRAGSASTTRSGHGTSPARRRGVALPGAGSRRRSTAPA